MKTQRLPTRGLPRGAALEGHSSTSFIRHPGLFFRPCEHPCGHLPPSTYIPGGLCPHPEPWIQAILSHNHDDRRLLKIGSSVEYFHMGCLVRSPQPWEVAITWKPSHVMPLPTVGKAPQGLPAPVACPWGLSSSGTRVPSVCFGSSSWVFQSTSPLRVSASLLLV